jgi:LmbE family N-acetylglucosaminyl deacetylase
MIVVAHPDDETLGAAAMMTGFRRATLVHITDGAPSHKMAWKRGYLTRSAYSKARFFELRRALSHLAIEIDVVNLGARDQRAALEMPRLTHSLRELLRAYQPDRILTHAFEGGHPDHDATAFVVHAAQKQSTTRIPIFEMSGYHNAFGIEAFGVFIPRDDVRETTFRLGPKVAEHKAAMVAEFVSQRRVTACFPTDYESFRPAPEYDFTERPHQGALFYEQYPFGMTWCRWEQLVRKAVGALEQPS